MTEDTESLKWLTEKMKDAKLRTYPNQISLMAKIWDFLVSNQSYDYTAGDLRKEIGYQFAYTSVIKAIWNLQRLGLMREYRTIGGKSSFQLSTWKSLA